MLRLDSAFVEGRGLTREVGAYRRQTRNCFGCAFDGAGLWKPLGLDIGALSLVVDKGDHPGFLPVLRWPVYCR